MTETTARTVLVVDDEPHIRDVVAFALRKGGFEVVEAGDGHAALEALGSPDAAPALVILDVMMPGMDGLEAAREIRRRGDLPILFLSSRDDEVDRIVGLEIGADDYVTKPFSPRELVARVNVILRRLDRGAGPARPPERREPDERVLGRGRLCLNLDRHEAQWDGAPVALTAKEFALMEAFLRAPSHVKRREALMDQAYGPNFVVSDRTIDSHVRHIRDKFAEAGAGSVIETVHGVGYRLGPCD